jgi:hypothetical protein
MVVADPDEALIEAIAEALCGLPQGECNTTYFHRLKARAAYAAMVEHLGLVKETHWHPSGLVTTNLSGIPRPFSEPQTALRRLVSRWAEVEL